MDSNVVGKTVLAVFGYFHAKFIHILLLIAQTWHMDS